MTHRDKNHPALKSVLAWTVLLAAVLHVRPAAAADLNEQAWQRGNEAYFHGDYAAAAAAYEQLDRQGLVSPDVYYNLGVCHFRLGNLGRAVWNLERAVAVDADDDDARFNLTQARKLLARRTQDKIEGAERDPTWIRLVGFFAPSTLTWTFVAFYLGFFVLLLMRRRSADDARATLGAAAAIVAVGTAVSGCLLLGRVALDRIPFAIVLPDVVAVKEGADPNYRTSFDIHAGLRVRLLETDQAWVRLRLANGLEGWVRETDVGRL